MQLFDTISSIVFDVAAIWIFCALCAHLFHAEERRALKKGVPVQCLACRNRGGNPPHFCHHKNCKFHG